MDELSAQNDLVEHLRPRFRLLVLCFSHGWGGQEQVAVGDAKELSDLGLNVEFLCYAGSPIESNLLKIPNIKTEAIDFRIREYFDFNLRRILLDRYRDGVRIFHFHQTKLMASIVPWLAQKQDVALLASRHFSFQKPKRSFLASLLYRRLDALVVMNEAHKRNAMAFRRIQEKKIRIIHLGMNFVEFDPDRVEAKKQRAEWGADEDTIVVGMVGRIDPAKGQAPFIKSAAALLVRKKPDQKMKFVIVGEENSANTDASYLDELRELTKALHVEDQIVFAGFKQNIAEVMSAFDVFVMPSKRESFGLVAVEAMAMECPIIISRGPSAEEIVGNEEYGLLVRAEDAFDLQRQLKILIDQPKLRFEMGKRARDHAMKQYDRRTRVRKLLELYERALRRRGSQ